jgi:hypothetical protein
MDRDGLSIFEGRVFSCVRSLLHSQEGFLA